jgi:hypothetical protein
MISEFDWVFMLCCAGTSDVCLLPGVWRAPVCVARTRVGGPACLYVMY